MMSEPYPIFINLVQQPVLLVGAGRVALRKARGLLAAGAALTVVGPGPRSAEFEVLPAHTYEATNYQSIIMERQPRWALVFAATDAPLVNVQVLMDARAAGILCCRCDDPESGDFAGGAVLQQSGLTLAVSTQGASPALAARLRDAISTSLEPRLLELSGLLAHWRPEVLENLALPAVRRQLLVRLASPEMEQILRAGGKPAAEATFKQWLREAQISAPEPGADKAGLTDEA